MHSLLHLCDLGSLDRVCVTPYYTTIEVCLSHESRRALTIRAGTEVGPREISRRKQPIGVWTQPLDFSRHHYLVLYRPRPDGQRLDLLHVFHALVNPSPLCFCLAWTLTCPFPVSALLVLILRAIRCIDLGMTLPPNGPAGPKRGMLGYRQAVSLSSITQLFSHRAGFKYQLNLEGQSATISPRRPRSSGLVASWMPWSYSILRNIPSRYTEYLS